MCTYICNVAACGSQYSILQIVYFCRINRIAFSFTLSSFFRNHIIENEGPVHAKFHIQITLLSDLYSSMTVDIEVDSKLRRYCYRNYIKASTIVDGVIMILLFFSSLTYIASIIRTYLLVKVRIYYMHRAIARSSQLVRSKLTLSMS